MTMHNYTATFANNTVITRRYAKPLSHAWRIMFRLASNEAGQGIVTKTGMSGTEALARKNGVKGKKYVVESFEVVETIQGQPIAAKTTAKKPKAVKPFTAGEEITVKHNGSTVPATVEKVGRLYVYVRIISLKGAIKIAFADASKPAPHSPALAIAA